MYKIVGVLLVVVIFAVLIFPAMIIRGCQMDIEREQEEGLKGPPVKVFFHEDKTTKEVPLEEYLVGVIAAEMPASFEAEALKAQAVAARTYTLKRVGAANNYHPDADICTDHTHAQAWISKEQMDKDYYKKIEKAVRDTEGIVLTFEGKLIDPVYHATCGTRGTENSEEVWKYAVPYLKGVACPEEEGIEAAKGQVEISLQRLEEILGTSVASRPASANKGSQALALLDRTSQGRVKTIRVGDKIFTGTEIRAKLGLRSTDFSWQLKGDKVKFITKGNGHAVGMCQYGANSLAKENKKFEKILAHYYQGVEITKYP